MSAIRLFEVQTSDSAPFITDEPTVRQILNWNADNASRKIGSGIAEKERRRIWRLFEGDLGDNLVASCRPFHLLNFINSHLGADASDWTRGRWCKTIQGPFNAAEKLGLIVKNPFRGLTFDTGGAGRDWTDEEYQSLLRSTTAPFRRVVVMMRFSGMRPGEVRELEKSNLRWDDWLIMVEKHKMRYRTKKPRPVWMNHVTAKLLAWLIRNNPPAARILFLNAFGRSWTCKALTKRMQELREKIGLPDDVKCHGGRHTFITRGLMAGVDVPVMMELAGHSQLATTQHYMHIGNKSDHLARGAERAIQPTKKQVRQKPDDPPKAN